MQIGRREAARRADRYSDMVPPSIAPLDLFVSNFSCEKNSSHHDSPVTAHDGLDPSFKSAFSDSIVSLGLLVSNFSCEFLLLPKLPLWREKMVVIFRPGRGS